MKKITFILLLTCISGIAYPNDRDVNNVTRNGKLELLDNLVYTYDLLHCDKDQVQMLISTIYARYGYIFTNADLKTHFSRFSWYKESSRDVEKQFNYFDIANMNFLKRVRENYPQMNDIEKSLIGIWYPDPIMPANEPEHVHFYPNGLFRYDLTENIYGYHSFSGLWRIENKSLKLTVIHERFICDSKITIDSMAGIQMNGGRPVLKYVIPEKVISMDNFRIENIEIFRNELNRNVAVMFGQKEGVKKIV